MCDCAWKDDRPIDNCGELAEALNCDLTKLVQYSESFTELEPDYCLCNVDIEESCKKFGHMAYRDDALSWEIEKIGGAA
ncbi:hypothetical protein LMG33818_000021 [Halomonadaceae bacterium LMG 33818]